MLGEIRNKRLATLAVIAGGGLALAGCGNTVEGVGNVTMVHCGPHGEPRVNSDHVASVPKGETIQMGTSIVTNSKGNFPATGDFAVTSKGGGEFSVSLDTSNNNNSDNTDTVAIIPTYNTQSNTVTITDSGELYTIQGSAGPLGSTALSVNVSCAQ